jgi:hypothetical protein
VLFLAQWSFFFGGGYIFYFLFEHYVRRGSFGLIRSKNWIPFTTFHVEPISVFRNPVSFGHVGTSLRKHSSWCESQVAQSPSCKLQEMSLWKGLVPVCRVTVAAKDFSLIWRMPSFLQSDKEGGTVASWFLLAVALFK